MVLTEKQKKDLKYLWGFYPSKYRRKFKTLFVLMIVSSFAEMLSIGSVLPFLAVLSSPDLVFSSKYLAPVVKIMGTENVDEIRNSVFLFFVLAVSLAGIIRYSLLYLSTRLVFGAGVHLSTQLFKKILDLPFDEHVQANSSEYLNIIFNKTSDTIYGILLPLTNILTALVLITSVLFVLIIIEPLVMLSCFTFFGLTYVLVLYLTRSMVGRNSRIIANRSTMAIKCLQEAIRGIRELIMSNSHRYFVDEYSKNINQMRSAQAQNSVVSAGPKFIIETLGILLIAVLAIVLTNLGDETSNTLPLLGALAIGAQRILPALQQVYIGFTSVRAVETSLDEIISVLKQTDNAISSSKNISLPNFSDQIKFNNVSFKYKGNAADALTGVNFSIKRGECIGVVGATGCGKSTLLDLMMGLLSPTSGHISIDGIKLNQHNLAEWQSKIAHVSQSIYFADAPISKNIAFGIEDRQIDFSTLVAASESAQINHEIKLLPQNYESRMGENGDLFSGGQKQRIGIARALYKQSEILILDEATSALDLETERKLIENIRKLGKEKTIIMVAHRLDSLVNCDRKIYLDNGKLVNL